MVTKVVIVGAGPCGVLLAHYLRQRSDRYYVHLCDRRPNPCQVPFANSRTYPITLNERAFNALRPIEGLENLVKENTIPILGSVFHRSKGKTRSSTREKPLYCIDRTELVKVLLSELITKSNSDQLTTYFNCNLEKLDSNKKQATFQNEDQETLTISYDLLIGTDGANSAVRKSFLDTPLFELEQRYVNDDYKTLFLPKTAADKLKIQEAIHSWRHENGTTLLLVPQAGNTASGVVTFPRGNSQIPQLSSSTEVLGFFNEHFPEIGQVLPESEAQSFLEKKPSTVLTIRCNRYHQGDNVLIMGDAAHAVSPSLGQGCNAALEDVFILNNLLNEYDDNYAKVFSQFTLRRRPDAHALQEMSDYAFPKSKSLFIELILRRKLFQNLHSFFPKLFPLFLFDMVSNTTLPYSEIYKYWEGWVQKVKTSNEKILQRQNHQ
ncbi:MAG: FAD-dependent oxidoreductase [Halothece sp.]